jgi:hypothetical protein
MGQGDGRTRFGRVRSLGWLVVALTVLHIAPIWAFRYFPSQDGPSHVENAYMLAHYFDKGAVYSQYYDLNLRPFPNWLSHAAMAVIMKVAPPLVAEKLLLTGYIVLFVLGMRYFLRSVADRTDWLLLLAFPFIYNYLLHRGYYNFSLSLPLAFVAIGYWWRRRRGRLDWRGWVGLNLLLLLVYSANILSEGVAVLGVLVLAAAHHGRRIGRTLEVAAALVPACVLPVCYMASEQGEAVGGRLGAAQLGSYLATIGSLTSFDSRERYVGAALAAVFAVLVGWQLLARARAWSVAHARDEVDGSRVGLAPTDGFLMLALLLALLYFLAPTRAFGGSTITYRLCLYPFLVVLAWLAVGVPRPLRWAAGAAALLVALVHLGLTAGAYATLNRGLAEYTSGASLVEANSTILPISFEHRGESARIGVYRHAGSYYTIASAAVDLANYEAGKPYFPLRYKEALNPWLIVGSLEGGRGSIHPGRYPRPVDYILLWSAPPDFQGMPWIESNYSLFWPEGRLRLYRHVGSGQGGSPNDGRLRAPEAPQMH